MRERGRQTGEMELESKSKNKRKRVRVRDRERNENISDRENRCERGNQREVVKKKKGRE